jgi:hypothetical protein
VEKGSLPNRFVYVVGADAVFTKPLTGAFDVYGQRLFSAPELISQPYKNFGNCSGATNSDAVNCAVYTPGTTHPDIARKIADVNITNASLGVKFRAFGNLVVTGNVLLKLDSGGLRSKAIPLVGVSYIVSRVYRRNAAREGPSPSRRSRWKRTRIDRRLNRFRVGGLRYAYF